jgi:hypothetical protein
MSKKGQLKLVEPDEGLNQEALAEFIEDRAFRKKPMSPLAIKKAGNLLRKYPLAHQQLMVDTAIIAGWRGLFPVDAPKESTRDRDIRQDLTDTSWAD